MHQQKWVQVGMVSSRKLVVLLQLVRWAQQIYLCRYPYPCHSR